MSEAYAENRKLSDELASELVCRRNRLWIARTVGEEDTIGSKREYVIQTRVPRHDRYFAPMVAKTIEYVRLDTAIEGDDMMARSAADRR